jgi:ABC-type sugar transport system permease subunit
MRALTAAARTPAQPRYRLRAAIRRRSHLWLFLFPAVALVLAFYVVPSVLNFAYAFTNWGTYRDYNAVSWMGLSNFRELSSEGVIWDDLLVTLKFAGLAMIVENVVALALALALEKTTRINGLFRSIFFIPVVMSSLAAGYMWKGIFSVDGVLNNVLSLVTFHDVHTQWLGSTTYTIFIIALIQAWRFGGIHMLVYIAALNSIPHELVESAKVEGASAGRIIRKIKLPLIGPAFTFNITLSLIGALTVFEVVLATTQGGPGRATEVMNIFVLNEFTSGFYAESAAAGLILFAIVCVVAFPLIAVLRRREVQL